MIRFVRPAATVLAALALLTPVNVNATDRIEEDSLAWNCMTMGNLTCGPAYLPVDSGLADALAEGDEADATTRDWSVCLNRLEPTRSTTVCPDGHVNIA